MYFALLEPGDTVLGMDLSHGGHLTHGHPVTYLSKIFNFVRYGMKDIETGEIDYEHMLATAKKIRPKIVLAGFSAYPRELDYAKFVSIAREVGAIAVMDIAHIAGLIAGGAAKNPFDYVLGDPDLAGLPLAYKEPLRSVLAAYLGRSTGSETVREFGR